MVKEIIPVLQRIKSERILDKFQIFSIEFLSNKFTDILSFRDVLRKEGFVELPYKIAALDVILFYIEIALEDGSITLEEQRQIRFMKSIFEIEEGDLYRFRYQRVKFLSELFLGRLYLDNHITQSESMEKVALQELFDLSYDQFLEFSNNFDRKALLKRAHIIDLDTFLTYNEYWKILTEEFSKPIDDEYKASYLYSLENS
jgi:hypothetical protein